MCVCATRSVRTTRCSVFTLLGRVDVPVFFEGNCVSPVRLAWPNFCLDDVLGLVKASSALQTQSKSGSCFFFALGFPLPDFCLPVDELLIHGSLAVIDRSAPVQTRSSASLLFRSDPRCSPR